MALALSGIPLLSWKRVDDKIIMVFEHREKDRITRTYHVAEQCSGQSHSYPFLIDGIQGSWAFCRNRRYPSEFDGNVLSFYNPIFDMCYNIIGSEFPEILSCSPEKKHGAITTNEDDVQGYQISMIDGDQSSRKKK